MSQQDLDKFSARRKRETLGAVSHNVSAIPMPASAMKRSVSNSNLQQAPHTTNHVRTTSGSRMSLAPGRPSQPVFQRSSSGDNLAGLGFSTVQRPSTANFLGTMTGRKSYAPITSTPANQMQLSQESTQRRSSVYSARPSAGFGPAGHMSFFATAPPQNGVPTDPRRLRDASTRQQMGQELMEFLTHRNFEMEMKHSLSHKTMTSPTQKDFNTMFQFLYHCVDPAYKFQKTIDAEVPPLLKQLRYPYEKNITKSRLTAVGGNNWSTFLGLLHWMMQLCKMMEAYTTGGYDEACIEAGYDVTADRITFQFLSDAYKEWLAIEDDDDDEEEAKRRIEPHVEAMAARFDQANQSNLEQIKALEAESKALQEQIDELSKSAPKLAKLDETIKVLEEDRVKFENYNQSMESKVEKYHHRADLLQQEIEKCEQEMREAEDDRNELQRRVDEQGISVQDIDRMNNERERLQRGVEATSQRLEEAKDRTSKKEAETGGKLDELESFVQKYNGLGYQIGVIPATAENAYGYDYELRLTVNQGPNFSASQLGASNQQMLESDRLLADASTGYQPYHLLQSDLKAAKKALQDLRKEISERRNAALEDDMAKMDMLDKTKEALDDKYAEMDALGHRMRAAQEEFEKTKEITKAQEMASDAQIERMEKELGRLRAGLTESVQLMEQREMGTNLEYEQLTLRSSSLREELHTELERMLNDVIKFKIHIQGSLEAYEEFVAQEVERECEEQEVQGNEMEE
ncbi:kinetochore-associated Ndc80 complex subunit ndc80 [Vermiconidia calcicola]|uniref:Kinetochore-associated Ndc80 complex subunit ndc80 n=1 Tax=Vermiconidia calcicola TaxID=1690605 RepID=A0ACC3N3U0_9PEZI|nr:kinetochore-associated Ndc80 complex subunit ndc80 [Vermiconidia calcicola]